MCNSGKSLLFLKTAGGKIDKVTIELLALGKLAEKEK